MVKALSLRFQQWCGLFTMLIVERSCERGLFRHLSNHDFGFRPLKNTSGMRFIFFLKMFKIEFRFRKRSKKLRNRFFVSEIFASEDVAVKCLYKEENTCYRQSMSWQTALRFCISLRELFPTELRSQGSINTVNVLWIRIQHCLGPFNMFLVQVSFETGLFSHLSNHVFRSP